MASLLFYQMLYVVWFHCFKFGSISCFFSSVIEFYFMELQNFAGAFESAVCVGDLNFLFK